MTTTLAVEHLFDAVSQAFTVDQINAVNRFGWRELAKHTTNLPRVVWVPGDSGGVVGDLGPARGPGQVPRALAQLTELFTVYLYGTDPRDPENEQAQYHVARMFYECWYVAIYRAAHGNFRVRSQTWVTDKLERRHGATMRVVCEVNAPITEVLPDEPLVGPTFAGTSDAVDAVAEAAANNSELTAELTLALAKTESDPGETD